jgi:hypothetical protein
VAQGCSIGSMSGWGHEFQKDNAAGQLSYPLQQYATIMNADSHADGGIDLRRAQREHSEQTRRYLDEFVETGCLTDDWVSVENACGAVGTWEYLGQWIPRWVADQMPSGDDFYLLEETLQAERLEKLTAGAEPSDAEIAAWQARAIAAEFAEGCYWLMVYVTRITDDAGREMWGATLHGDRGILERSCGPFRSEAGLIATLTSSGVFRKDE